MKKPLYDAPPPAAAAPPPAPDSAPPTPTARLAVHIGTARRFVHAHTELAQRAIDAGFTRYLEVEGSVTGTIAGLAPPRSSEEKVVPGLLYVAVTTMAGSIVARRRMLPVRVVVPVAVAVGAGWYFLPETSANVGALLWQWEKRVPQVAETHLLVRGKAEEAWRVTEKTVREGRSEVDEAVKKGRRTVEGWVGKSGSG